MIAAPLFALLITFNRYLSVSMVPRDITTIILTL